MYQMQCFNTDPHEQHQWTFHYNEPPSVHICPGFPDEEDA